VEPIWRGLASKLVNFNPNYGGVTVLVLGAMGSGKTHLLLNIAAKKVYEARELCVWRGLLHAQAYQYFPDIFIHVKSGYTLPVYDEVFTMWPRLRRGCLNVVYAPDDWWLEYLLELSERVGEEPMSVFIDEFEDIAPSYSEGDTWHQLQDLSRALRAFRKAWVNFYVATQNWEAIDYRILNKFVYRVYLPGARRMRRSPVRQAYINRLSLGEFIVEERGAIFTGTPVRFPPMPHVRKPIKLKLMSAKEPIIPEEKVVLVAEDYSPVPYPKQLINTGADRR